MRICQRALLFFQSSTSLPEASRDPGPSPGRSSSRHFPVAETAPEKGGEFGAPNSQKKEAGWGITERIGKPQDHLFSAGDKKGRFLPATNGRGSLARFL